MSPDSKAGALLKTLLFSVTVPGSVAGWIPLFLLVHSRKLWHSPVSWLGWILIALGTVAYLLCAFDFSVQGGGTPAPIDAPKTFVAAHLYRITRNPMYVGVLSVVLGEAVIFRSEVLLAYAAFLALTFNLFVVFYEEPKLAQKFGDSYHEYCRRVPRWVRSHRP